jgi:hypothetical protein
MRHALVGTALSISLSALQLSAQPASAPSPAPAPAPAAELGPTRLFFAPTARSLPRGGVSLGLTEVAFPWVELGIWDRFSVQAAPLLFDELTGTGLVVAPKLQVVRSRWFQAAAGTFQVLGSETGGVGYAVATVGSADTAATVGYGYGYGAVADSVGSPGLLLLGAEKALSRSVRLTRGGWSVDLGVVVPVYETGGGSPAPLLTVARAF